MCYVIITGRSLAWLLLSLVAFMLILTGIMTPKWLLGQPVVTSENNMTKFYVPSVGIYNRCIRMRHDYYNCAPFSLYGLATDSTVYPKPWKAALFFLSLCAAIQFSTVLAGVMSCCVQSVFKKSVISLAGATQALGGLFGVLGLLLYPWGWGAPRVKRLCGEYSEPYIPGDCSIGWAFFVTATGVAQVFLASALSKTADKAANSDKVQFQMDEGGQRVRSPHYQKLRVRVIHIRNNHRGQPRRSAMEGPRSGRTAYLITVSPTPGIHVQPKGESRLGGGHNGRQRGAEQLMYDDV